MKNNKVTISLIICLISIALSGCLSFKNNTNYSKSGLYYDTVITVTVYGTDQRVANELLEECMNLCDHYEKLFDPDIKTSDIAKINSSDTKAVHVDPDTIECIQKTLEYSKISDGKFDVTIKPLSDLWDFHGDSRFIPSSGQLNQAAALVDYNKITIDPVKSTVSLSPGTSIELGAAAKGYIADKIKDYLSGKAITGAIINMGGDMCLMGTKPDGKDFNIGINDPSSEGEPVMTLNLHDISVATSGTYERCFTSDGRKYHHILNTVTGYPVDTDVLSVTVISENSFDCDCLCTLCVIEGSEKAVEIINAIPNTEAIIILNDGTTVTSTGAGRYIKP